MFINKTSRQTHKNFFVFNFIAANNCLRITFHFRRKEIMITSFCLIKESVINCTNDERPIKVRDIIRANKRLICLHS